MPAKALHVSRGELAELTCEDDVRRRGAAGFGAGNHQAAGGQLVMTKLLTNIWWLQV